MKRILVVTALLLVRLASAGHHEMPKVEMPKEFDQLKGLVGTWEGTTKNEKGEDEKVTVVYELTSGGTAVVEKTMQGTEHEMTTVYHKEGKTLAMTHYCALGNQPHMVLKKSDAKMLAFEMTKPTGLTSAKEPHMHGLTLTWENADTVKAEWQHYADGKKQQTVAFTLNRKKV